MGYVILQLAVTLDGYIARIDGTVDFLDGTIPEFDTEFQRFVNSIDSIVMGRNTYDQMLSFGPFPFPDKDIYVLTHQSNRESNGQIRYVNEQLETLLHRIQGPIWLFGGAEVIKQCMNKNLIDEYQLFVVPHLIGNGIRLFPPHELETRLSLTKTEKYGDNVLLVYKKHYN